MLGTYNVIPILFTCSLALRCIILVLESTEKRRILLEPYLAYPEETTSGPFSRGVLLWLRSLLFSGYKKALALHDLPPLDGDLGSEMLANRLRHAWSKGGL